MISLLMPTRGRLRRALEFLESVVATASDLSQIEVVAAIDDDDRSSGELASPDSRLQLVKIYGPRTGMGELNTRCLQGASGKIIMLVNDDILIRTPHWDKRIREEAAKFPDEMYLMHTRDGFKDEKYPIFPILSRKCCELIGDPFPKEYVGDGIDAHLYDIFLRLKDMGKNRIHYLPDVFFEHMHYKLGKADNDAVYGARSHRIGNRAFYRLWRERDDIAQTLYSTRPVPLEAQPFRAIFSCFLHSRQKFKYRISYLLYHSLRETYFLLGLHRLKVELRTKR